VDSLAGCTSMAPPLARASSSPRLFIDHFAFPFFSLLGAAPFQYHENCKVNKLSCSALLKLKAA
jgi:hypothetical protein